MAAIDADRNLLFGLLALQNGLIDQAALCAAFAAWTLDKRRPLADHLVELGHLDAPRRAVVDTIAGLHVQALGGDPGKSLAVLAVGRATRESLSRAGGPDLETTLGHVGSAASATHKELEADGTGYNSVGPATSAGQRFHVLRPHARGGLGAVYVALDSELDREVALKQILDDRADDPTSRYRFLVEAQITGGLEHPGIVPVYGLGTYRNGRPYYAMRFIRGVSFKEAIDHFHGLPPTRAETGDDNGPSRDAEPLAAEPVPPGSRDLALRKLLRRFLDVCNAIDYAHSRGVLHRDIKPANIILGKHGETLVVDWGLAKPTGRIEPGTASGERLLMPYSASGSSETLPGSTLGTPAYMSPEQARGDLEHLGPRSDVYSLGATLYCLLTGKPPFEGGAIAVLPAVRQGAFPAPRSIVPSIDRALEAVCLKAMALDPADRYATPKALGEEVERWMADESVAAYREPWTRTLTRWLAKHRTQVTAAGAALLVALAGLVAVMGVQARANGRLSAKNTELDIAFRREAEARKEAQTNFDMALKAVDDYLTSVSENTLFKLQDSVDIRRLRQELLNSALKYYKGFVQQRSHDPHLRRQLADAYFRVGEITREVESPNLAIEAYHQAQAIWEPLIAAHPEDQELQGHLAESFLAVAKLQDILSNLDPDKAMKSLDRARAILEPLAAASPLEARYQSSLADCYSEIAIIRARLQHSGESLALLEKATALEKDLIQRYPDKHVYQKSLAEMTNVLGYAYYKLGNNDAAMHSFHDVENICRGVSKQVTVGPKPLWLLKLMALSEYNIGSIHKDQGDLKNAIKAFEESVVHRSALVDSHPSVSEFKVTLALSCRELAITLHKAHQDAKALQAVRRSVELLEPLVRAQPDQAGYHSELGLSWNYLGCLYDDARNNAEARVAFEKAVAEQQLAADKANQDDDYPAYLANHLENLGEQYVDLGRVAEGLPFYRRSLKICRDLSAAHPKNLDHANELLRSLIRLGSIERHAGEPAAARELFTEARTMLDRWSAAAPGDAAVMVLLGAALDQEADALFDQGLAAEARQRLERAAGLLQSRPDQSPADTNSEEKHRSRSDLVRILGLATDPGETDVLRRRWRSEALWDLARVLRALNLPAKAEQADGERVAVWKNRPPGELVDLAFDLLDRAILVGYGKTSLSDQASAVRDLELDQASECVRLAIARGFNDLGILRSHPDSTFLLTRDQVKPLIMDMAFPAWPFGDR